MVVSGAEVAVEAVVGAAASALEVVAETVGAAVAELVVRVGVVAKVEEATAVVAAGATGVGVAQAAAVGS